MKLDADGLPIPPPPEGNFAGPAPEPAPTTCDECGKELTLGVWPWCPHGEPRYGWHFGQGQNDARRQAFYEKRAADPFGSD